MATNKKSGSKVRICAAAALVAAASSAGGVAVMEAPDPQLTQDLGVSTAGLAALNAAEQSGADIRSSKVSKKERKLVKQGAVEVLLAVGLGQRSQGYGPILRQVIIKGLKATTGGKRIGIKDITADALVTYLSRKGIAEEMAEILTTHMDGLETEDVAATTIEQRTKNLVLAKAWIAAKMAKTYVTALKTVIKLGSQVTFTIEHGTMTLPLNRALGVAYGRSISAAELFRAAHKTDVSVA